MRLSPARRPAFTSKSITASDPQTGPETNIGEGLAAADRNALLRMDLARDFPYVTTGPREVPGEIRHP